MGTGQLSLTKVIVLVDAEVDPRDRRAVFEALARNFDPAEDFDLGEAVGMEAGLALRAFGNRRGNSELRKIQAVRNVSDTLAFAEFNGQFPQPARDHYFVQR